MTLLCNEFLSSDEIYHLQERFVQETIGYAYKKSKFYGQLFDQEKIEIGEIKTLSDIHKLPFTTKKDLHNRNQDFFCVEKKEIVELVTTSGSTSKPIMFPLTKSDLERLALNEALSFSCINTTSVDLFHIMVNMGNLFVAGLAYYLGLTKLGATVLRVGSGMSKRQLHVLETFQPNGIVSIPSFLLKLGEVAMEKGIDLRSFNIDKIAVIGEAVIGKDFSMNELGKQVKNIWGVRPYSTYGSTEMSTSFSECPAHCGLHSHPELIFIEIIDEGGNPVADGEMGELVVTTLQAKGMPLIRYKTGDITFKISSKCTCGRNTERIGPIIGRKNQMIKSKGTTIYPGQIEESLRALDEIIDYVIEVSTGKEFSDDIILRVGVEDQNQLISEKIKEAVKVIGRVTPEVKLCTPEEIEKLMCIEGKRKKQRFIDLRKACNERGPK